MLRRWPRIKLDDLVAGVEKGPATTSGTIEWAEANARAAETDIAPVFPGLPYTEMDYRLVLLFEHIQRGQICPKKLRRLHTDVLAFIAGIPEHREIIEKVGTREQQAAPSLRAVKIAENAARAARELENRALFRTSTWSAVIGATIGALVATLFRT